MSGERLSQFQSNVARAHHLVGVGTSVADLAHGRLDVTDLYRFALVQGVAALDAYVHGVVEDRAVDIVMRRVVVVDSGAKFGLTPSATAQILAAGTPGEAELEARKHIAQRLSRETFQRPDDIASALAAVGLPKIWSTAFADPPATITALGLVVTRRNIIAHQCDTDPFTPASVIPLSATDALQAIRTIADIVIRIDLFR